MGLGDIVNDIGDFVVPESVENWAGGVAGGLGTLAEGAAWAANPTHWDDIGRGIQNVGEYVIENPGKTWDTAFEVGRHIVKEELLDPKNLAINLALTGATIATGGGTSGIMAARLLKAGKAGTSAFRAARAAEEGTSILRAGSTAMRAMRGVERGLDVAEDVGDVSRLGRGINRALSAETDVRRAVRGKVSDLTGGLINREASTVARARNWAADVIAPEGSGLGRTIIGQSVGVNPARPIVGGGRAAQRVADMTWRARRAERYEDIGSTAQEFGEQGQLLYDVRHDPLKTGVRLAEQAGYDPMGMAKQAVGTIGKHIAKEAMKREKKPTQQRRESDYGMVSAAPQYSISAQYGGSTRQSRGPQVSREETVSSTLSLGRQNSFYGGMAEASAYAPENETYAEV